MKNEIFAFRSVPKRGIDKKFLAVKFVLFFWYAAGMITAAFLPVFLKHQGLTVSHFSIFTGISVCLQFSGGIIAAYVADKIGSIKPFLFFFLALFCVACLCLIALPSVANCRVKNASFVCYDEEIFHLSATSCEIIRNNPRSFSCSKISVENGTNLNGTSGPLVALLPNFDVNFKMENLNNISGLYSSALNYTNCSVKNIFPCISESCKSLQIDYSAHFMDCDKNKTFWIVIYGVLVVFYNLARTNVYRFIDIIVWDLTSECNSDFGRQRVLAILGNMIGPVIVGIMLDVTNGSIDNEKSYTSAFVCAIIFSVFTAFCMGRVNPKFHKPASEMWKKSLDLVKNLNIIMFFALLVIMGCVAGFQTTYRNWYLKELGASDLLTGIVSGIDGLYGIPFLCKSKWFINKIGVRHVFILGLLGHVVYSFSFSAMEKPWIALIIESTTILSYHLFWVAVIQYSDEIAPVGLVAIMKVLAGSLHYSIGKLGSSLVGGYVMNTYGGRTAFIVLGCIALAYTFVYGSYLIIQRLKQKKIRISMELSSAKEIPEKHPDFT